MIDFPILPGITPNVLWRPIWSGVVQQHVSGAEFRASYWTEPLWEFEYSYEFLRDGFFDGASYDELKKIVGCFNALQGTTLGMRLFNPDDNSVVRQLIGTTNGSTTTFDLVRTYGADNPALGYGCTEHVGFVDTTLPFYLYVDSSPIPKPANDSVYGYTLSTTTPVLQQLVFATAPPAGHNLYVGMHYLYYARFRETSQEFQRFMTRLWSMQKVVLKTLRSEPAS